MVLEDELFLLVKLFIGSWIDYTKSLIILTPFNPSHTSGLKAYATARENREDRIIKLGQPGFDTGKRRQVNNVFNRYKLHQSHSIFPETES